MNRKTAALIIIFLAGVTLRFAWLDKDGYELDEGASLFISDRPLTEILNIEDEPNPPLFFSLLHLWIKPGRMVESYTRLLPAFFSVLSVLMAFLLGRQMLGAAGGLLLMLFVSLSPHQIFFAQELRSYSLLFLLSLSSCYFFWKVRQGGKRGVKLIYIILTLLLLHTHIYGWFVFLFQCVWILWKERPLKKWLMPVAAVIFLFLPYLWWFIPTLLQVQGNFWLNRPGLIHFFGTAQFLLGSTPLFIVYGGGLGLAIFYLVKNRSRDWLTDERIQFLLVWIAITYILPFLLSQFLTPFFMDRYLIVAVFPILAILAWILNEVTGRTVRMVIVSLFVLFSGWEIYQDARQPTREPWRTVAEDLKQNTNKEDDILVAAGFCIDNILMRYAEELRPQMVGFDRSEMSIPGRSGKWEWLDNNSRENIWLVLSRFNDKEQVLLDSLSRRYRLADTKNYYHRDVYGRWVSTIRVARFMVQNRPIQK